MIRINLLGDVLASAGGRKAAASAEPAQVYGQAEGSARSSLPIAGVAVGLMFALLGVGYYLWLNQQVARAEETNVKLEAERQELEKYIRLEKIPIVPLYFAAERPVVERDGTLIMVDDERMPLRPGEVPMMKHVRFRTLGCYPLTGAIESTADTLPAIIQEMLLTRTSERQGRMIDHDQAASMEKKKQEGYF